MNQNDEPTRLIAQARLHLSRASTHLEREEIAEVADNSWAAATAMIEAAAIDRGWKHDNLRDLFEVVSRITQETGDAEFRELLTKAHQLQWHADDGCLPSEWIVDYFDGTAKFVEKMRGLLDGS